MPLESWEKSSWRSKRALHQPSYQCPATLETTLEKVSSLPPLVFVGEIEKLKQQFSKAEKGEAFILQGGDCAERFQDCNQSNITAKLKILLQMSVVLCYGAKRPVIRVGRIAGQYAKPRSNPTEVIDGVELPVYRGDIINSFEANIAARTPKPERILEAFHRSSATLNYIRALTKGGFADLHNPHHWNLDFVTNAPNKSKYEAIVSSIRDAIEFMESLGTQSDTLQSVEFYTSHEGLLLPYEEAMTQYVPEMGGWYNLGAHFLWIGDRTRQLDGAHIEYFRGVKNPIGIKVGPTADPREIISIVKALNPNNESGKINLIARYGAGQVSRFLPDMIQAVKDAGISVVWTTDPMHGNAAKTTDGIKTRDFNQILSEIKDTFQSHQVHGSTLGGIHFELTGEDVTECIGGSSGIKTEDLDSKYETYCDPRLNYSQSLEMAFLISEMLGR